jgi:hypothetical protein
MIRRAKKLSMNVKTCHLEDPDPWNKEIDNQRHYTYREEAILLYDRGDCTDKKMGVV